LNAASVIANVGPSFVQRSVAGAGTRKSPSFFVPVPEKCSGLAAGVAGVVVVGVGRGAGAGARVVVVGAACVGVVVTSLGPSGPPPQPATRSPAASVRRAVRTAAIVLTPREAEGGVRHEAPASSDSMPSSIAAALETRAHRVNGGCRLAVARSTDYDVTLYRRGWLARGSGGILRLTRRPEAADADWRIGSRPNAAARVRDVRRIRGLQALPLGRWVG
jgi:hypothetical protein